MRIDLAWANYGPRAKSGPFFSYLSRPQKNLFLILGRLMALFSTEI